MNLIDWTFRFLYGYRNETDKLPPEDRVLFEPFVKEQMLSKPCQVEAIKFYFPYRIFLLFFFDRTKPDSLIDFSIASWDNVHSLVEKLVRKYKCLKLQKKELYKIFSRFSDCEQKYLYSMCFIKDICHITFTNDPRIIKSPLPQNLGVIMKPWEVAEMIFNLHYIDFYDSRHMRGNKKP